MKRLAIACSLLLPHHLRVCVRYDEARRSDRGVLRGTSRGEDALARALLAELRDRGLEAFDVERTFDELMDDEAVPIADYIVEIRGGEPRTADYGGVGIGGRHADVELGVVSSAVTAELRVYDGWTMRVIAANDLAQRSTALMPTAVGIGGRPSTPTCAADLERVQHRSVAKKAAREAASLVSAAMHGE